MSETAANPVRELWPKYTASPPLQEQTPRQTESGAYVFAASTYGPNTALRADTGGVFEIILPSAAAPSAQIPPKTATVRPKVMSEPTREEIDSKFETVAAKTDTKFAELIGEIRVISSDLKGEMKNINTHLNAVERSTAGVKGTIIVAALATIAIVIGVLAFGQQWFGIGITMRDIIRATVSEERLQREAPTQSPSSTSAPTQNPSKSK